MTDTKHTPGPWKWEREWKGYGIYVSGMGCLKSKSANVLWFGMDGAENIYCPNLYDARLIAESPEMLELLKYAADRNNKEIDLTKIDALIARIEKGE